MKTISLKIDDPIFKETEEVLSQIDKARNRYINEAIAFYNKYYRRKLLEKQFEMESLRVRDDSMDVLKEFEQIENED